MRIKVINPNTTESMTRKIGEAARAAAAVGTEIVACNPAGGPVSIEGHYDEAVSVLGLLDEVRKGEAEAIEVYRGPGPEGYGDVNRITGTATLTLHAFPDVELTTTEIFA